MLNSITSSAPHACGGNSTNAKTSTSECGPQNTVEKRVSWSIPRHENGIPSIPMSQTTPQNTGKDPLGRFSHLPYELHQQIWSDLANCGAPLSSVNYVRFKWPERCAENPGHLKRPTMLLPLMLTSKAIRDDVYPILERQMKSKTFNISFTQSHGVQFESIRCAQLVAWPRSASTPQSKGSVCQNVALSAFARALPLIRYLNVTIELENNDQISDNPQSTLGAYVHQACSVLSNMETTKLEALNTNIRLHIDCITTQISTTGKPTNILINTPSGNGNYPHDPREWEWHRSSATRVGAWMANAVAPLHRLAGNRGFLGDSHFVTLSESMCRAWSQSPRPPTCMISWIRSVWVAVEKEYFEILRDCQD